MKKEKMMEETTAVDSSRFYWRKELKKRRQRKRLSNAIKRMVVKAVFLVAMCAAGVSGIILFLSGVGTVQYGMSNPGYLGGMCQMVAGYFITAAAVLATAAERPKRKRRVVRK